MLQPKIDFSTSWILFDFGASKQYENEDRSHFYTALFIWLGIIGFALHKIVGGHLKFECFHK